MLEILLYHFDIKIGAKGKAALHCMYIIRTKKYRRKRDVAYVEHGNMPAWAAASPMSYWEASDTYERENGTVYREIEVSLPRGLTVSMQIDLARQLAAIVCGHQHAYTFAIHHAKARDGGLNPHIHLQFSERIQDGIERDMATFFKRANKSQPEKGGCLKDRSWQATQKRAQKRPEASPRLLEVRKAWAEMCNQALQTAGSEARVDHRSYAARGIYLIPQPKLGAKSLNLYKRTGIKNDRYKEWEETVECNKAIIAESNLDNLSQAEQRLADAEQELASLDAVPNPDRSVILRNIIGNHEHVRRISREIHRLEHVVCPQAYGDMMNAKRKRDAGSNWFMRAYNRFWFGGDYNRLAKEYEVAISMRTAKAKEYDCLIKQLYRDQHVQERVSEQFAEQAVEYQAYLDRKADLEQDILSAKKDLDTHQQEHLLESHSQPESQTRSDMAS